MASRSQPISIQRFLQEYENDNLMKPRVQRKKRWSFDKSKRYIVFLIRRRNGIIPFLVNERVMDAKKVYYIFDGNNRSNAILDFCLAPLSFMADIIPSLYGPDVAEKLKTIRLADLFKDRRYTYDKFCRQHGLEAPPPETMNEYELAWDAMMDDMSNWNVFEIELPMTVFDNISDEEVCDIYASTNSSGTPLSLQELLASSTNHITFSMGDLKAFRELEGHVNEYYGEMNNNEKLKVSVGTNESLNLFEVLTGLQIWLHNLYPGFVPGPSNDKDNSLDVVFKVYEAITGGFTAVPSGFKMNEFIEKLHDGCALIDRVYSKWIYDSELGRKDIDKYRFASLNKNNLLLFLVYLYETNCGYEQKLNELIRVALFHELLQELGKKDRGTFGEDIMEYKAGGRAIPDKVRRIRETKGFGHVPSPGEIRGLLDAVYGSSIMEEYSMNRKTVTRLKAIAFSAFFNYQIPSHMKSEPQNKDHIVPYSKRKWADKSVDICRLGNLQLIAEEPNKSRGNKTITDTWIDNYGLHYQRYPSEREYAAIVDEAGEKIDAVAFVAMCEKREAIYLSLIMRLTITGQ